MTPRFSIALISLALVPAGLFAQKARPASEIPKAYSAIRESDLRRDVAEMAGPGMRGREGGTIDEMRATLP